MSVDLKKTFWSDAAVAGSILGALSGLLMVAAWLLKLDGDLGWINSILSYVIIVGCIYYFGKKRAALYGNAGFSYGQSQVYIMASMIFAGVIVGLATFLMQNVIAPEYYQALQDVAMANTGIDIDTNSAVTAVKKMLSNPISLVLIGIFSMVMNGFFIGLIISIFIKKQPNIFAEETKNDGE